MIKSEKGISLIELILVIAAVAIVSVLIISLPQSILSIKRSGNISLAREIASKQMDFLRKQPYQNLSNGTVSFSDVSLSRLSSSSAFYEVADCPVEICTLGETAKKLRISVNWVESGKPQNVELVTMASEGGLGQ